MHTWAEEEAKMKSKRIEDLRASLRDAGLVQHFDTLLEYGIESIEWLCGKHFAYKRVLP